jgi:TolB-like protein
LISVSPLALAAQQDTRPAIAVFPLEGTEPLAVGIQQLMINHLAQNPSIRVVERLRLKEILTEIELGQSGKVSQETALKAGRLANARYLVLGGYLEAGKDMVITTRIIDTETSESIYSKDVKGKKDGLFKLIADLGDLMEKGVKGLPPLPAAVREERRGQEAVPAEAGFLYSQALAATDNGLKDVAINLYQQLTQKFPQFKPAREALQQLRGT